MDPIEDPNFNEFRPRPANPERSERIRALATRWRRRDRMSKHVYDMLVNEIREAKKAGHSYQQLADDAELPISRIQRMTRD